MPEFIFNSIYSTTVSYSVINSPKELGDCFQILGINAGKIIEESWSLSGIVQDLSAVDIIESYQGIDPLEWRLRKPLPVGAIPYQWNMQIDDLGEYIADKWNIVQQSPGLWKVDFNFNKWNHWIIDECSIKAVDLLNDFAEFPFDIVYGFTRNFNIKILNTRKNGGIETRTKYGYNSSVDTWSLQKTVDELERTATNTFLSDLAGRPFRFRNNIYNCLGWSNTYVAPDIWTLSFDFKRSFHFR